jgi:hypothetical protein
MLTMKWYTVSVTYGGNIPYKNYTLGLEKAENKVRRTETVGLDKAWNSYTKVAHNQVFSKQMRY